MVLRNENDKIHGMVPSEQMTEGTRKLADAYERIPDAPLFQNEFGFFSFERWEKEGHLQKGMMLGTLIEMITYGTCLKDQEFVTLDELIFSEDICYNHGSLISPDMIREFLFPYYQQLITNIKRRQINNKRRLYFQVDSDGFSLPIIKLCQELGMD